MADTSVQSSGEVSSNGNAPVVFPKLEKLSRDDICFRVFPVLGGLSYGYFSIHIMNSSWFKSIFPSHEVVANSFWFNAHLGVGLYLFGSQHLRHAPVNRRILYSVFGSFLFNFGSVLFWATCKSLLPERPSMRAVFGLLSGFVLLYVGREYVEFIDSKRQEASS